MHIGRTWTAFYTVEEDESQVLVHKKTGYRRRTQTIRGLSLVQQMAFHRDSYSLLYIRLTYF